MKLKLTFLGDFNSLLQCKTTTMLGNLKSNFQVSLFVLEIMLQMGFSRDEIQEALTNNRYDEVMATYLLLDEKRQKLTVRLLLLILQ